MPHWAPTFEHVQAGLILVGAGILQSYAPCAGRNADADAPAQTVPVTVENGPPATYSRGIVAAGKPAAVVNNTAFTEAAGVASTNIADEAFGQVPPTATWCGVRARRRT